MEREGLGRYKDSQEQRNGRHTCANETRACIENMRQSSHYIRIENKRNI